MRYVIGFAFVIFTLGAVAIPNKAHAQFLKQIINDVKQTAQNRANNDASNATNKALDKVEHPGKKKKDPGQTSQPSTPASTTAPGSSSTVSTDATAPSAPSGNTSTTPGPGDQDSDSSYLTLDLSVRKMLLGNSVTISGRSIQFGNLTDVTLEVSGNGASESKKLPMTDSGHYSYNWRVKQAGVYTITVTSSNGKSRKSEQLDVYRLMMIDSVTKPNRQEMERAIKHLETIVQAIVERVSTEDAKKVKDQLDQIEEKKDHYIKVIEDIETLGKTYDKIQQGNGDAANGGGNTSPNPAGGGGGNSGGGGGTNGSGQGLSDDQQKNLNNLNQLMSEQADQMKKANDAADHQPSDNTICEYLEMVTEACNALNTVSYFFTGNKVTGNILAITANLALNKAIPNLNTSLAGAAGANASESALYATATKQAYALHTDAENLGTAMGKLGLAGDMVSTCTDHLMRSYCVTMSGTMTHDYTCTYRNSDNETWWEYTYKTQSTVSLRYQKSQGNSKIIKMKGNIEGNATYFHIFQKMSVMDDFRKAMKNRATLYSICLYVPPAMGFSSSQLDRAMFNFGAVARGVVTPAYFNIPIDADYDPESKQMTLYVNDAIVDFSPSVQFIYGYIIIAAGIPLTERVNFPINKAKLTIGKVISENKTFQVQKDSEGKLSFIQKGTTQIGKGAATEHNIHFTMNVKGD